MVTNQDGLGTDSFPEDTFWPVHNFILKTLETEGIHFSEVHIDRTFPADKAPTRKPGTGMLGHYQEDGYDLGASYVIGDRLTDMELAKNLGAKGIFLNNHTQLGVSEISVARDALEDSISLECRDWQKVYEFLKMGSRVAEVPEKHGKPIFMSVWTWTVGEQAISIPGWHFLIICSTSWRGMVTWT